MELIKLNDDLDVIQKLDDEPNDVGGMTADELKKRFDQAPNAIKEYINGVLIPGIVELLEGLDKDKAGRDELQGVVLNQIPDGTVTAAKLNTGAVTREKLAEEVQASIDSRVKTADYSAGTLPVSEGLAASAGLQAPAFAEGVMAVVSDNVNGLLGSVAGIETGVYRWKTYRWNAYMRNAGFRIYADEDYFGGAVRLRTSSSLSFSQDGEITLVNSKDMGYVNTLPGVGTYFQYYLGGWNSTVYQVLADSTLEFRGAVDSLSGNSWTEAYFADVGKAEAYSEYLGEVTSEDNSAYPEDGWLGDVRYVRTSGPRVKIPQIQVIEHIGTGAGGKKDPTVFTFDFAPKVMWAFDGDTGWAAYPSPYAADREPFMLFLPALSTEYTQVFAFSSDSDRQIYAKRSADGKTVSVYSTATGYLVNGQLNEVNKKFFIVGIG